MKNLFLLVIILFTLFTSVFGVFASNIDISLCKGYDGSLVKLMSDNNLRCVFQSLGWFNWVLYISFIIVLTVLIKEIGLKKLQISNRAKSMIAFLIAFMGITGLMYVMIQNNRLPQYLALFISEILVLAIAALIIKSGFNKDGEKYIKPVAIRILMVFIGIILINSYHQLLIVGSVGLEGHNIAGSGGTTILYELASFHINMPFILYIVIYGLMLFLFANEKKEHLSDEEKENKKKLTEYKKLMGLLGKEAKSAEENFSKLSHMLNSHNGGRR